jgi:hypothetical protein
MGLKIHRKTTRTELTTLADNLRLALPKEGTKQNYNGSRGKFFGVVMILPQVHLRKPCYDFTFL